VRTQRGLGKKKKKKKKKRLRFYWEKDVAGWQLSTLPEMKPVNPEAGCHVSAYEAGGLRQMGTQTLPRRAGVGSPEAAALSTPDVWEWNPQPLTVAYPGYVEPKARFGEYHGKFMATRMVAAVGFAWRHRWAICVRPTGKPSSRPNARWMFGGLRLGGGFAELKNKNGAASGSRSRGGRRPLREFRNRGAGGALLALRGAIPSKFLTNASGSPAGFARSASYPNYYLNADRDGILRQCREPGPALGRSRSCALVRVFWQRLEREEVAPGCPRSLCANLSAYVAIAISPPASPKRHGGQACRLISWLKVQPRWCADLHGLTALPRCKRGRRPGSGLLPRLRPSANSRPLPRRTRLLRRARCLFFGVPTGRAPPWDGRRSQEGIRPPSARLPYTTRRRERGVHAHRLRPHNREQSIKFEATLFDLCRLCSMRPFYQRPPKAAIEIYFKSLRRRP